jgi:ferredoxin-NADP reductase
VSAWVESRIDRVEPATPRLKRFFLTTPLARHVAGQHVDVRLTAEDGYEARRSYSIASAPGASEIELLIERLDDGEVSLFFHDIALPGDTIELRGPLGGHFIWRPADGGPLLLVAGGSGVAPLMAMVRDWAGSARATPLMLVYSARTSAELAFADELRALEATAPSFTWVAVTTREAPLRERDRGRRIDSAALRALLAAWGQRPAQVFVCGSNRFVEAVTVGLLDAGVPAPVIRTERYGGA